MSADDSASGQVKIQIPVLPERPTEDSFIKWVNKFKSYANIKGIKVVLEKNEKLPDVHPSVSEDTEDMDVEVRKLVIKNDLAVSILLIACDASARALNCHNKCCTEEYPDGLAHMFWEQLNKKFAPKEGFEGSNLQEKLRALKWKEKKNPMEFFDNLAKIQNLARHLGQSESLKPRDFINKIIKKAPEEYRETIKTTMKKVGKDKLTVEDLEEACNEHWLLFKEDESDEEDLSDEDETALYTENKGTGFKGKCYKCDKHGHRANQCNQSKKGGKQNGRFKGKCNMCNVYGHMKKDCWEDDKNADKRPKDWKSKLNSGLSAEQDSGELALYSGRVEEPMDVCEDYEDNWYEVKELWDTEDEDEDEKESAWYDVKELWDLDEDGDVNMSSSDEEDTSLDSHNLISNVNYYTDCSDNRKFTLGPKDRQETALMTSEEILHTRHPNIWIADTGATVNVKAGTEGLVNKKKVNGQGIFDNGGNVRKAEAIGDLVFEQYNKDGVKGKRGTLTEVMAGPEYKYNLISVSKYIEQGWKFYSDNNALVLENKKKQKLVFDIKIKSGSGYMYCTYLKPVEKAQETALVTKEKPTVIPDDDSSRMPTLIPNDDPSEKSENEKVGENIKISSDKDKRPTMNIREAHCKFGHAGEDATRKAAEACGYRIVRGSMAPCEACAKAKAKQKNLTKDSDHEPSTESNGRIYMDQMTLRAPKEATTVVTKPNWLMMVDEKTKMKFSTFHQTKSGFHDSTCAKMNLWKQNNMAVKTIRCDNAKENKDFESKVNGKHWKLNVNFEYTGRATPQRNSLAETSIATIHAKARAAMIAAKVPMEIRCIVGKECINCITQLDALQMIEINGEKKSRHEHWNGKLPAYAKALRTWGEAGTVTLKQKMESKMSDRGVTCMFVGYNSDSGDDVYRMWNPETKRIHCTRDIIWLKRYFFENDTGAKSEIFSAGENGNNVNTNPANDIDESIDDDFEFNRDADENFARNDTNIVSDDSEMEPSDESENENVEAEPENENVEAESENNKNTTVAENTTRSGRTVTAPSRLIDTMAAAMDNAKMNLTHKQKNYYAALMSLSCHETDGKELEAIEKVRVMEHCLVGAGIGGGFQNTAELKVMKFNEAMRSSDREGWIKAVEKEHDNMTQYNVWEPVEKTKVPDGVKVLSSTWAMKKKANGTLRARMVARGYEQIDGMHYDSSSIAAPVTNELSIRIMMVLALMAGWAMKIVDIKGAFLRGEFEEGSDPVYLEIPQGFEKYYPKNCVLRLLRTLYGLSEAAMAFWKQMLKAFEYMEFNRSKADPCLYYKWTAAGFLIAWLSWIDDCACFGPDKDVEEARTEMNELFECDDIGDMEEYVGCQINREEGELRISQPVMLQSFEDEFDIKSVKHAETPASPGTVLTPVNNDGEAVNQQMQTKFRSGLGKLLHMMRWSKPEIYNAVRDLSRHAQRCSVAHVKALYRVMRYCVDTKHLSWRLKPERKWDGKDKNFEFCISGKSDSDYATCPTTRRSVTGFTVFLEGAPISVKSLMQKIVALSVCEAEVISAVTCAQEMIMAYKIITSLELKVKLPMILEVDNKGAVDLANNWSTGGRTKHMDVRFLWLRELKEKGLMKVVWLSGVHNDADLFTKNLPANDFKRHRAKFTGADTKDNEQQQGENVGNLN